MEVGPRSQRRSGEASGKHAEPGIRRGFPAAMILALAGAWGCAWQGSFSRNIAPSAPLLYPPDWFLGLLAQHVVQTKLSCALYGKGNPPTPGDARSAGGSAPPTDPSTLRASCVWEKPPNAGRTSARKQFLSQM